MGTGGKDASASLGKGETVTCEICSALSQALVCVYVIPNIHIRWFSRLVVGLRRGRGGLRAGFGGGVMRVTSAHHRRRSGRVTNASLLAATMWRSQSEELASCVGSCAWTYWALDHGVSASLHIVRPLTNVRS